VGNFNGDGFDDLAISVWREELYEDPDEVPEAGLIHVVYGSTNGLGSNEAFTQDTTDVADDAENFDQWGWFY
jgi:hypothetical protein